MNLKDMVINTAYSFSTRSAHILGASYADAKLISVASYEVANKHEQGLAEKHMGVYPDLPSGTPRDATRLQYLVFSINGSIRCFAYDWLQTSSIEEKSKSVVSIDVKITNTSQHTELIAYLARGGYTVIGSKLL